MTKRMLTVISMLLIFSAYASAVEKGSLALQSTAEKEIVTVDEKGKKETKLVPVSSTSVVPGDEVIYTISYENIGKEPATSVVITNPVPEHMTYIGGSAEVKGAKVDFSVDKGKIYAPAGKLTVKGADGKERSAGASDYTNIRWTLEKSLEKGRKGSVSFKAKVK